jgi:hypothetical protein
MLMHCTVCGQAKGRSRREETCPDCEAWAQATGLRVWAKLARARRARREARRAFIVGRTQQRVAA